jgi:hypothetical protein
MTVREVEDALDDTAFERTQKLMRAAVKELMSVHRLSERDAASIMMTVTSAVDLSPKRQQ